MRYYLDTEFNEFGGELLSLALVPETARPAFYAVVSDPQEKPGPWVSMNVIPILHETPRPAFMIPRSAMGRNIRAYLDGDPNPIIVADWPDDIRYFCQALIVGPGMCVNIPRLTFEWERVDSYPTTLHGAVQHNAYWDAMALRYKLTGAR